MSETPLQYPWSHPLRIADLPTKKPTRFTLVPNRATLTAIANELGLLDLKKLRFEGEFRPVGRRDWYLDASFGATAVQACVVTLKPVTTRIDEPVRRLFLAELEEPEAGSEIEMPDDDTVEPLADVVDLGDIMVEALALFLPLYPRAEGAELPQAVFTEPGQTAMTDEDARPFAGLKSLRDKLENKGE